MCSKVFGVNSELTMFNFCLSFPMSPIVAKNGCIYYILRVDVSVIKA